MGIKYYMSFDNEFSARINAVIPNTIVFTTADISRALNLNPETVRRKIRKNDFPLNEISEVRARELGKAPNTRQTSTKYLINGENLSPHEIAIKYSIPLSTIRLWLRKNELDTRIALLSNSSYISETYAQGATTSIWKYRSVNQPEIVRISQIVNIFRLEHEEGAENIYNEKHQSILRKLQHFYRVLENTFKYHIGLGKVMRQLKLCFVANHVNDVINFIPQDMLDNRQTIYRMIKPIIVEEGVVRFFSFDDFVDKLLALSVGYDANGIPTAGSDPEGYSVIQNFALNPALFSIVVEHSVLCRANIVTLRKNLHAISVKHPYFVLFNSARPYHKNSCFFDSLKISMNSKGFDTTNIKKIAQKYEKGIRIEDIEQICQILGVCVEIVTDFTGLTPPNNFRKYGPIVNDYSEPFKIFLTHEPESHFSAVIGVREKLYPCEKCLCYFNTVVDFKKHPCVNYKKKNPTDYSEVKLYFDVETVNNPEILDVEIYSVSWKWSDQTNVKFACNNRFKKNSHLVFLKDLQKRMEEEALKVILIAYNGSSFDVWTMIKNLGTFINFTNVVFKNGRYYILNGVNLGKYGSSISVWDPFLFLGTSLNKAAASFHLPIGKHDFSHEFIQNKYNENRNFDFIDEELENKIEEYNNRDVEILEQICERIHQVHDNCYSFATISSLSFNMLKDSLDKRFTYSETVNGKTKELTFLDCPVKDKETYDFFRKALTGGRVQTIEKFKKYENVDLTMIDVVSLYPSIMYFKEMPVKNFIKTPFYVKNFLGIYNCEINYQRSPSIIPLKEKNKPLNWEFFGNIKDIVLTSVEIECLRKHFGEECVNVYSGVYWEHSSADIFKEYIDKWMTVKKEQDSIKNTKEYNPCMREFAKKMLNTPYGKTIQKVFETGYDISNSANKTKQIIAKYCDDYEYTYVGDGIEIIEGKYREIGYNKLKPIQLGIFILAYARCKMYDEVFSKTKVYYSDTDSALVETKELEKLCASNQIKIGSELGCFDVEMTNITDFWSVGAKSYALKTKDGCCKIRLKGISRNSGWTYCGDDNGDDNGDGGTVSGDCLNIELFDYLLKDPENVKFFCSHFHHRKNDFALEFKNIVKKVSG